jgi:hypothetical protein
VATTLVYFMLGKTVSLVTVFGWMRYLWVVLLPAGFFAAARLLELPPLTAAASPAPRLRVAAAKSKASGKWETTMARSS